MRLLQGSRQKALADIQHRLPLDLDVPIFAFDVVGRLARPDFQHRIDRLDEHGIAVCVQVAERFGVGKKPARADAEDETAIKHVVQHGDLRCGCDRMRIRHVDRAGAELDGAGRVGQA